jgi:hypothetical protein
MTWLGLMAVGCSLLGGCVGMAGLGQAVPSRRVVEPSKASVEARSQELAFTVAAPGRGVIGTQVFLNPGVDEKLTSASEAYVGEVYFSDHPSGPTSKFVLPLKRVVSGKSEMVLLPILGDKWGGGAAVIRIAAARIEKPDNGAFR